MNLTYIKTNLCSYDPQNPNNCIDDWCRENGRQPAENGCGCDNCFYGRDKLARQCLALLASLDAIHYHCSLPDADKATLKAVVDECEEHLPKELHLK